MAEVAPGEVIPVAVSSECLGCLNSAVGSACSPTSPVDLVRAAIEIDCSADFHKRTLAHAVAGRLKPLEDLDRHGDAHDELRRWFDAFAAAPPLYFVYTRVGTRSGRLRNLLAHCRSPSREVVDSATDFMRRSGRPQGDASMSLEWTQLATQLADSDAVRGMEVQLAECFVEHVGSDGAIASTASTWWESLCHHCIVAQPAPRVADATAIADMCPSDMGFSCLVAALLWKGFSRLETPEHRDAARTFVEHLHTTKPEARGMIRKNALTHELRSVVEWVVAFSGERVTSSDLIARAMDSDTSMLFDVAIRDDRCVDDEVAEILLAVSPAFLTVEVLRLPKVARELLDNGTLAGRLFMSLAKKKKTRSVPSAEVLAHLAASPGLRRNSDGWFEAIAFYAKRRDVVGIERLLGGVPPPRTPCSGGRGSP